jgi:2-beta-glucuronyltransferase
MKISLLTVHDATSSRKVDFHFWADVFAARGYDVDFITLGLSPFTFLKQGGRSYKPPFNRWLTIDFNVRKFLWCPLFHPFKLANAVLDKMTWPLFSLYSKFMPAILLNGISNTDIFIVENGAGLMLIPELSRRFPKAKFVYTVCDRLETLGYHPIILQGEKEALKHIDLVRVPAEAMIADYSSHPNVHYISHGLDKNLFDKKKPNPYKWEKNAVSVGDMLFDGETIAILARNFPDWIFHLFGKKATLPESFSNVITYGEMCFADTVAYIQHASIGIAPYKPAPSIDYISQSSMKMIQYTYCRLPIIAPNFAAGRAHVQSYNRSDAATIITAMERAIAFDRDTIDSSSVMDWESTVDVMLDALNPEEIRLAG